MKFKHLLPFLMILGFLIWQVEAAGGGGVGGVAGGHGRDVDQVEEVGRLGLHFGLESGQKIPQRGGGVDIVAAGKKARVRLDLMICLDRQVALLIKYAPGSLTTRHQVALAFSRLLAPYQVPFSVVTNGEDADILDNIAGSVVERGLSGILSRKDLQGHLMSHDRVLVADRHREMAAKILYAYEVDGRCPCDDSVCEWEHS